MTGNTILNWSTVRKLNNGIIDNQDSRKTNFTRNNINYYQNEAIQSPGEDSLVKDNVFDGDNLHDGNPNVQYNHSFQTESTDLFINNA